MNKEFIHRMESAFLRIFSLISQSEKHQRPELIDIANTAILRFAKQKKDEGAVTFFDRVPHPVLGEIK